MIFLPCRTGKLESCLIDGPMSFWRKVLSFSQKILGLLLDFQSAAPDLRFIALANCGFAPLPVNQSVMRANGKMFSGHKHPKIQFIFLATRLALIPSTHVQNY